ncbi:hypothetical protein N865_21075 [Intrasporangium oryzae NRRL B-24470]|uniref:Uncharacterized protein n=1 Tax=Intrasporangium oryzae NRRL B-24470 TaxID=1386089 RepID=W9G4L4_9MICO|nr:hypothetical protein [Intrasporangium oryzae]EWS99742.1 hypothetical protein N865_21075 [Intrasporangium oryzae NRRL B-24470]
MFLLVAGALGVVLVTVVTNQYLRVSGDTTRPGFAQGIVPAALSGLVVLVLAGIAVVVKRTTPVIVTAAVLTVVAVAGPLLGAAIGVNAKSATYTRVPDCLGDAAGGAMDPAVVATLRTAQAAFDSLEHPAPFYATLESGSDGCVGGLDMTDATAVWDFYRSELTAKGWSVTENAAWPKVATKNGLTITVSVDPSAGPEARPTVRIALDTRQP